MLLQLCDDVGVVLICSVIAINAVDAAVVSERVSDGRRTGGRKILGMLTAATAAVVTLHWRGEKRLMVRGPCYSVGGIYKRELFTLPAPILAIHRGRRFPTDMLSCIITNICTGTTSSKGDLLVDILYCREERKTQLEPRVLFR